MSLIFSIGWFLMGIFWAIAGKPFLEVCACFLLMAIFDGVNEMKIMREEMKDWEEDNHVDKT